MDAQMWKLILIVVVGILLIVVVLQNTATVEGRFIWIRVEAPMIIFLLITSAGGFIIGVAVAMLINNKNKTISKNTGGKNEIK